MLVKTEARIPIFPGTDFYFPSMSVPPGTFLGSVLRSVKHCQSSFVEKKTKTDSELL